MPSCKETWFVEIYWNYPYVVDFTNALHLAFTPTDHKSVKRYWRLNWIFTLLRSARIKAARRTLMKLTCELSENLLAHSVWWKNQCSTSPTIGSSDFRLKSIENLPNLVAFCQTLFANKSFCSCLLEKAALICWLNRP